MNNDSSLVRLENVHKWFGSLHVLKGIDLSLAPQEVLVISDHLVRGSRPSFAV